MREQTSAMKIHNLHTEIHTKKAAYKLNQAM